MLGLSQKISNSSQSRSAETATGSRNEARAADRGAGASGPDPEQVKRLLSSPEGQALIRLLQADGGAGIRAASAALQSGDMAGAQAALSPLLEGTDAEKLTKKMEEKL